EAAHSTAAFEPVKRLDELSFTATACLPNLPEPAANPLIFKGLHRSCGGSGAHYRASNRGVNIKIKFFLEMADAKVEHNTTTE
ncbi:hypothetical protein, partial [Azotobacter chroococcum]|uniref:hypothetical protein n=1 Tax=Azotobacter chroococcum TaxID=353 RepID=UPI001B8AA35C